MARRKAKVPSKAKKMGKKASYGDLDADQLGLRYKSPPPLDVSSPEIDLGNGWKIPKKRKKDHNPDDGDEKTITEPDDKIMVNPKEYVNRLENKVEEQNGLLESMERQIQDLLHNNYNTLVDTWFLKEASPPEVPSSAWPDRLGHKIQTFDNWAFSSAIVGIDKWKDVPSETKKVTIARLKGWVVPGDFDEIVSRMPPNFRTRALMHFVRMLMLKECLELFFENGAFWYMKGATGDDCDETGTWAPSSLPGIYDMFRKVDGKMAAHWKGVTTRLLNVKWEGEFGYRDPTPVKEIVNIRAAKARQFAQARLADKHFTNLLRGDLQDELKESFCRDWESMAHLSMEMSKTAATLSWRTLEDGPTIHETAIPPQFYRRSLDVEGAHSHKLCNNGSRLDKRPIIAILSPAFGQFGGIRSAREVYTIKKAEAIIDDPLGMPGDWGSDDEEAEAAWQKCLPGHRRNKKRNTMTT